MDHFENTAKKLAAVGNLTEVRIYIITQPQLVLYFNIVHDNNKRGPISQL
jgi:hypothetical protein